MSAISLLFSSGCKAKVKNLSPPEEQLTSVSIYQNHMDRTCCYSFSVRKEQNSYIFDADCMIKDNDEYYEVNFTDKEISEKEFEKFTKLDEKYNFISLRKSNIKKENMFFALDETITNFSVSYGDKSFSLYTSGDCYNEVYDCFIALAKKYSN
ncbi:MAG: hypothetical protein ACI4HO_04475 [Ruminococcus sp.]